MMLSSGEAGDAVTHPVEQSISLAAYSLEDGVPVGEPQILFHLPASPDCEVDHLYPAPDAAHLLLEFSCHANSFILLWDLGNLAAPVFALDRGYFLDWSPDSAWFLFRDIDTNQVLLAAVDGSTPIVLEKLPFGVYNATFSLDGKNVLYTASRGLGFGSELGLLSLAEQTITLQKQLPQQTIAFPRWSPDSSKLAYILLADNNIPYTIGELWVDDMSSGEAVLLADVDAGRGYAPVWSPDGNSLVYVHRENPQSLAADYLATALHSNLYQVDAAAHEATALTAFSESLVYDAAWAPDGSWLAFTAADAVWLLTPGQEPTRLTGAGVARHPAWIALPESNP